MIKDLINTIQSLEEKIENAIKEGENQLFINVCSYCDNLIDIYTNKPIKLTPCERDALYKYYYDRLTHGMDLYCFNKELDKVNKSEPRKPYEKD